MSKKEKRPLGAFSKKDLAGKATITPKHEHSWKAVRFVPFSEQRSGFMGGSTEISGTRVGFECEGCPERRFQDTTLSEEDARWAGRADESVPDAFVNAFTENNR